MAGSKKHAETVTLRVLVPTPAVAGLFHRLLEAYDHLGFATDGSRGFIDVHAPASLRDELFAVAHEIAAATGATVLGER